MLPTSHTETPEEAAERQANFIVLRSLESKLSPQLFQAVLAQASDSFQLPKRIDWRGLQKDLSFQELKVNFSQVDQNYLPLLLQSSVQRQQTLPKNQTSFSDQIQIKGASPNPRTLLSAGKSTNLLLANKSHHLQNFLADQKKNLIYHQISRYERMKTVFGHALIEEGYNAPIYNVKFDQTGSFVISGADDGIIKIWDRDTLNLQAALHSHEDVITDMDISKCNKYLATASKDGKIILWDWKNCKKVDELAAHNGTVNNIKFFSLKVKNSKEANGSSQAKSQTKDALEEIQILVTCSEDGTIKLYDEINYLNQQNANISNTEGNSRKSRTRGDTYPNSSSNRKERFCVLITPDDFRPGSKNKKIDSIHINKNGLLAAGSDRGEIFLWELDIGAFKRQQSKCFTSLGSSKKHLKSVHFCEFSPNGNYLFTGSVDGTAKIWNVEKDRSKKTEASQGSKVLGLTDDRLVTTLEEKKEASALEKNTFYRNRFGELVSLSNQKEKKNSWQCDSLVWSAHGRYAIAALSGKYDNDQNKEISVIKIWDSCTEQTIQDITKGNGISLQNFSFVLATHPNIEEIFISGSDGGIICLWNIRTRQLIKKFLEYGIYSFEKYTMNDPYDGRFSPDGNSFVVGSVMGTISLFSCDPSLYKYDATRVEQFFTQDDKKHNSNIYYGEESKIEPQVCSYNLIPYEVQPPCTQIGKFKNSSKQTHEEFERNYVLRRELCIQEENFIQGQLEEGLRNNMFNPDNQDDQLFIDVEEEQKMDIDEEEIIPAPRRGRPRIGSQLSHISRNQQEQLQASQEDVDALNDIRRAQRQGLNQRGRRQNIANRANRQQMEMMSPNFDPDRESDENFEIPEEEEEYEAQASVLVSSDDDPGSDEESEELYGIHTRANRRAPTASSRVYVREERVIDSRRGGFINSRSQRANRRAQILEEEKAGPETRNNRRRAIKDESESEAEENDYEMSDVENDGGVGRNTRNRRRLQRNNRNGESNTRQRQVESDDDSSDNEESEAFSEMKRRGRGRPPKRNARSSQTRRTNERSNGRNLRARNNRKNYEGMDETSDSYEDENNDESDESPAKVKEEEKVQTSKRRIVEDSDEEMVDHDVIVPQERNSAKLKGDEDYELIIDNNENIIQLEEDMINGHQNERQCAFCLRKDGQVIGPFKNTKIARNSSSDLKYFHKDCIEVNDYSFYSQQKGKWLNISKALEQLTKKPSMCHRCNMIGATIKCKDCSKHYHGYLCSQLYMIWIGGQSYQCFSCRNNDNYQNFREKPAQIEPRDLKLIKRSMTRDHLLMTKQKFTTYIPQVGDQVYYFFQGHEKFISYYNCYFYCGDSRDQVNYPWKQYPEQLDQPTLCRVDSISYRFPSKNALSLIKRYGRTGIYPQIPQVITQLTLSISNTKEDCTFTLEIFPNDLPDFLILRNIYDSQLQKFTQLLSEDQLINHEFKSRCKNFAKIKIVGIQEKEQLLDYPTHWESVVYKHIEAYSFRDRNGRRGLRRGDQEDNEPPEQINFWEIVFNNNASVEEEEKQYAISAMDANDRQIIMNIMLEMYEKKEEDIKPFMDRVTDNLARDYKDHICAEMWLTLIQERLTNSYYRTFDQLFFDFDQIVHNCRLYNGDDNELSHIAKRMMDKLKKSIKQELSLSDDLEKHKTIRVDDTKVSLNFSKIPGKLTAPSRYDTGGQTSMDIFKKQQAPPMFTTKRLAEETKYEQTTSMVAGGRTTRRGGGTIEDFNVTLDGSESYDSKITPKTIQIPAAPTSSMNNSGGSRRLTRTANQPTTLQDFSTDEKQAENQDSMLGKRTTRSGRQTKQMKQSLREEDLYAALSSEEEGNLGNQRKRVRQV